MEVLWAEGEKLEEILERRRRDGSSLQAEVVQKYLNWWYMNECPKMKERETQKKRRKFKGWSTEGMKDKPCSSLEEDTGEMIEWRSMIQEEMDQLLVEEEVLGKYKVEDSTRGAYRGRGSSLEWRRVRKSRKYRIRRW